MNHSQYRQRPAQNWRSDWRRNPENSSKSPSASKIRFTSDGNIEGVSGITNRSTQDYLLNKLTEISNGYKLFQVSFPVGLDKNKLGMLKEPYVVGGIPYGIIYILYIDQLGHIYMRNHYKESFLVENTLQFPRLNGGYLNDTCFKGFLVELHPKDNPGGVKQSKRYAYVIHDITRCNGEDISGLGILDRMARLQSDVMTPRRNALSDGSIKAYKEPFEIHAIDYKEISQLADLFSLGQYLTFNSADSRQTFRCPIRSLYFVPKNQRYLYDNISNFLRWDFSKDATYAFWLKIQEGSDGVKTGQLFLREGNGPQSTKRYYAPIQYTEKMDGLDGRIVDCKYLDDQWVFIASASRPTAFPKATVIQKLRRLKNGVTPEEILRFS